MNYNLFIQKFKFHNFSYRKLQSFRVECKYAKMCFFIVVYNPFNHVNLHFPTLIVITIVFIEKIIHHIFSLNKPRPLSSRCQCFAAKLFIIKCVYYTTPYMRKSHSITRAKYIRDSLRIVVEHC